MTDEQVGHGPSRPGAGARGGKPGDPPSPGPQDGEPHSPPFQPGLDDAARLALLGALLRCSDDAVVLLTSGGLVRAWNPGAERLFGYQSSEAVGCPLEVLTADVTWDISRDEIARVRQGESVRRLETVKRRRNGQPIYVRIDAGSIRDSHGAVTGIFWIARDIGEQRRLADSLQRALDDADELYENAPCGYHTLDANGLVLRMNATHLAWLQYSREEVVGKRRFAELLTAESAAAFERDLQQLIAPDYVGEVEYELLRRDGTTVPVLISVQGGVPGAPSTVGCHAVVTNISVRKRMERMLEESLEQSRVDAMTDPLTGVPNRRRFDEVLDAEIARARRYSGHLSLVILDLDRFKSINDDFGHAAGDAALVAMVRRVTAEMRKSDVLVRLGGDEFALLMPEVDQSQALACSERIRNALESEQLEQLPRPLTASFGIVELAAEDTPASLVARADQAMYRSKAKGRNSVTCG